MSDYAENRPPEYAKRANAKATVGEALYLAQSSAHPATVAARFAIVLALLACVVSAVALAVAVGR